jgi:hypothetical protein
MNKLPEEIQGIIYKYKHQLEFCDVITHIEFQFVSFCPSCGQGISFCFGKRCKCPREIRDNISVVSDIDQHYESSYESDYSDESYELDDLFIWDVEF